MRAKHLLRRYPGVPFIVLAYVLAYLVMALVFVGVPFEPLLILGSWTPNIAAFLVVRLIVRERGGIRRLLSGWGRWRVGVRWYVVAVSPLLVALAAAGVFIVTGGTPAKPTGSLGVSLLTFFVLSVVTGATGEELGWRGFLLPRLQERFSALTSSLVVGLVWALWHLPLWFLPGYGWEIIPYWAFALGAISSSVLFTFVLNNTGGSLLMASIIHLAVNFGMGAVGILGLLPSPREGWMVSSILYTVYAVAIIALFGPSLSRTRSSGRTRGRTAPGLS